MVNPLEITYYARTGYNPSDEPANDAVINLNENWTAPLLLKEYTPCSLQEIKLDLTDDDLHKVDFLKIRDTVTDERWYYYVAGHKRLNEQVVVVRVILDAFATVGSDNISFFGNVTRRSLSAAERTGYQLLAEPWAPRRPLKVRRMILDLNVDKTIKIPSHISTNFEETGTAIEKEETAHVPSSPLSLSTFPDTLSIDTSLAMGYPNAAEDTSHTIDTPWGAIEYTTPYEQYHTLSGTALTTFLEKAKKYNALDLIEAPYYLPNPSPVQNITVSELSNPGTRNPKASRHFTTITIRSLASNSSKTYSDSDTDIQFNQSLAVIIAPDKSGGIYVVPATIRDTGLNAYTYLDGVYSPFESVVYNAIGDTPAKFAADGTNTLNSALNDLFQTYINKINALQYESMQAKYFKDVGVVKGVVMSFISEVLGTTSETVSVTDPYNQITTATTTIPQVTQTSTQTQNVPGYTQTQSQTSVTAPHTVTQTNQSNASLAPGTTTSTTTVPRVSSESGAINQNTGVYARPSQWTEGFPYTSTTNSQGLGNSSGSTTTNNPQVTQTSTGSTQIPAHSITSTSSNTTAAHSQTSSQDTSIPTQTTRTTTTQHGAGRDAWLGNLLAIDGIVPTYDSPRYGGGPDWSLLQTMIFGGYRNEVHSFMLGNINDYLNRWVSIQNDLHNGKVANLFKNITLVGNNADYNKLVGKYEIVIASLQPEDEINFDLFLDHFGHAVDEYSNTLVNDVRDNYNYTLVGEDAILANNVMQDANAQILNQFRTGVRVWKKVIRPENY